jgi:hypothetical protein
LWQSRRTGVTPNVQPGQRQTQAHPRRRWSGRTG